ncbi:MAG: hypothetical protein EOP84_10730 [Verrucomicrobiaceae bacterium]|nr:MAG: hypothetical protein EOP84_10730 [Verrucomicrobiaceae bacterium]
MNKSISDHHVFFVTYDEPDAETLYAEASAHTICRISHVSAVTGFDAMLQHCAERSTTERFVTIDGDNRINPALFFQRAGLVEEDVVQVFKSKNNVTGLEYDHGGVKIWPRNLVLLHPTHEKAKVEEAFVDVHYRKIGINFLASENRSNFSPLHAYRTAYREATKLTMIQGVRLRDFNEMWGRLTDVNRSRLLTWLTVGSDVDLGWWSILGARQALWNFWVKQYAHNLIHDFDRFARDFPHYHGEDDPEYAAKAMGRKLNRILGIDLTNLEPEQSRFVKRTYLHPEHSGWIGHGQTKLDLL